MRVSKLTFAALAVVAGLSLTACQNDDDGGTGKSDPSSSSAASSSGGGSGSGGSDENGKAGKCRTDELEITAADRTIDGDGERTVAVTLKNGGGRDCTLSGYAGVDLKTSEGTVSAERSGEQADPVVLKDGKSTYFGITYPDNDSGGSGVRVTGLVVTPPNETKSVTLDWPGAATLPVTDGSGSPVKVGPMGGIGQGD